MTIIALIIATIIPLVSLYVIYTLDLYKIGTFRYVLVCFLSGGASYLVAALINPIAMNNGTISYLQMVRFLAPITEETLKSIVLLVLVRRHHFTYFVDGAIYGFSAGIGFAIFENYEYVLANPEAAFAIAINRVISTNLMHASASGIVGIVFGLSRFRRFTGRIAFSITGIVLAIALHTGYNNLITRIEGGFILLYAVLVGGGAMGFITLTIRRGLVNESKWIEEKLGQIDRVEPGEVKAVQQLGNIDDVLAPLVERFGPEKASQAEKLLLLQARLGITRKTLDLLKDEKLLRATQAQVDQIRQEMDNARKEIGSYTMLYLRSTYLAESSSLYRRLETIIQVRAQQPHTNGVNIWDTISRRVSKRPDQPG